MDLNEILAQLRALDPLLLVSAGAALLLGGLLGGLLGAAVAAKAGGAAQLRLRLAAAQDELAALRAETGAAREARSVAETRLEQALAQSERERGARAFAEAQQREAEARRIEAERQTALSRQEVQASERRMRDWETARQESLQAAKAAVLHTANEVSSKLLTDHKREAEAAKKQNEEVVRKTTEELFGHFKGIAGAVEALRGQVTQNGELVDTVYRALSSPGGAGRFAELGLENTLKSFGLRPGQDFVMQYAAPAQGSGGEGGASGDGRDGGALRPDAVVFLPRDAALVIDSKASKFVVELAEAEGEAAEAEAYAKLARTMNQHLKALTAKDYRKAVIQAYARSERPGSLGRVTSVMYLPNDGALEKLHQADPEILDKAHRHDIILAGPAGLAAIVSISRFEIDQAKQEENRVHIVAAARALLDSLGIVLGHMEKVGRGLKSSADNYQKMTASVNSRFLPRARRMAELGVRPSKGDALTQSLPAFQVLEHHGDAAIDTDVEDVVGIEGVAGVEDVAEVGNAKAGHAKAGGRGADQAPATPRLALFGGQERE